MRFLRFQVGNESPRFGWIFGDQVGAIEGSPFGEYRRMEAQIDLASVHILAPVLPGKIICLGRNYAEHARERNVDVPEIPLIFFKPPSAIIGNGSKILIPPQSNQVEHEAELAIVIGKPGRWIQPGDAMQHVLGYTIANDVTARDLQNGDKQWTRGKGFDTFCPIGPWIETDLDPADVLITCRLNGELRQMASTREMIFTIPMIVAFISSVMTLEPGDLILTGTPAGVGALNVGDLVEISIEGIGELKNSVAADTAQP